MKLSGKERKLRKEVYRILREDNIVSDPDASPEARFALALVLSCSADTQRAARISGVCEGERAKYTRNLRRLRVIHHDRLDLSEVIQSDASAVLMIALLAMACSGETLARQPCRSCGAPCRRSGYTTAGAQRWECSGGCGRFVYLGNELERMRADPDSLREALRLAKKGWSVEGISSQSAVSVGQAKKVAQLVKDDPDLEFSSMDIWYTAAGHGKTPTKWRPKSESVHQVTRGQVKPASDEDPGDWVGRVREVALDPGFRER